MPRSNSADTRRGGEDYYSGSGSESSEEEEDEGHRFYTRVEIEKPISIYIYKNDDEYDPGRSIKVTRRRMRNWVSFLDYLTDLLKLTSGAVHHVYTAEGEEVRHFRDLEQDEEYVAASGSFSEIKYGTRKDTKWAHGTRIKETKNNPLNSNESYKFYLERNNFRPTLEDMWDDPGFDRNRDEGKRSAKKGGKRSKSERRGKK